jgi:pimeloyl-ACP methyl ester carboxylesterase
MSTTAIEQLTNGNVPADMPRIEGVRHLFVQARGIRFHVAEAGEADAPAVVMLHGWPSHWYCWRDCFGPLADAGLRPIAIDLRGFGWSEKSKHGYRKAELANDVLAVLDTMGITEFSLIGHDWGGFVAFLLGLHRPDRVTKLILTNTGHGYTPQDLETVKAFGGFFYMPLIGAPFFGPKLVGSDFLRRQISHTFISDGSWTTEEADIFMDKIDPHVTQQVYGTFIYGGELLRSIKATKTRMKTPTLFLYGDADVAIKPAMVRGMEDYADDYRLEVMPGLGHFCFEQAPEVVVPKFVEFLR